ncbi:MAG: hypothetical protein ACLVJ6_09420 [Merdibacter sp.]
MASAIRMSVRLCTIRQRLLRQLFKQASYPIVLLVMAFVLVLFFLSSIFPQLQQLSDTSSSSAALLLPAAAAAVVSADPLLAGAAARTVRVSLASKGCEAHLHPALSFASAAAAKHDFLSVCRLISMS